MRNVGCWLALVVLTAACSGERSSAADRAVDAGGMGGAGGMSGAAANPGMPPGTGGVVGSDPQDLPGGDTSDLGTSGHLAPACGGQTTGHSEVSLEEARARGFDVDTLRAQIEGTFEADLRWEDSDEPTRVRVEVACDDTATIGGWDCGTGGASGASCLAGNFIVFALTVSVATSDQRLQGSFIATSGPVQMLSREIDQKKGTYERSVSSNGLEMIEVHSSRWAFDGMQSLDSSEPGAPIDLRVVVGLRSGATRVYLQMSVRKKEGTVQFTAFPLDGCAVYDRVFPDVQDASCYPPRFGGDGYCCNDYGFFSSPSIRYPLVIGTDSTCPAQVADSDAGIDADDDAGTASNP